MNGQKQRGVLRSKSSGLSVGPVVYPRPASEDYVQALKEAGARESLLRAASAKPTSKGFFFGK
jgi:hypothetical protein